MRANTKCRARFLLTPLLTPPIALTITESVGGGLVDDMHVSRHFSFVQRSQEIEMLLSEKY